MKFASQVLAVTLTNVVLADCLAQEGLSQVDTTAPLSALVAIGQEKGGDVTKFVKKKVDDFAFGDLDGYPFHSNRRLS